PSFEEVRRAVGQLVEGSRDKRGHGYRLTFEERNTRKYGKQSLPVRISFDTLKDFLLFLGKKGEAETIFSTSKRLIRKVSPLETWVRQNPKKIFKHMDPWTEPWEGIIRVLHYFRENPRPGMYLRELPIHVHTKFIEGHRGIFQELLEVVIPDDINWDGESFEQRFHLRVAEPLIRFRGLDPEMDGDIFALSDDMAIPRSDFNRLEPQCRYVVIVENQMTYLTLPFMESAMAIYGGGFKVENLKEADWLKGKTIIYWGDIDAHGFLI
ncbi:MAG: hypothetical protein GY940_45935, partial [bacterium]|nr:hypothetical protein [bacterium]